MTIKEAVAKKISEMDPGDLVACLLVALIVFCVTVGFGGYHIVQLIVTH